MRIFIKEQRLLAALSILLFAATLSVGCAQVNRGITAGNSDETTTTPPEKLQIETTAPTEEPTEPDEKPQDDAVSVKFVTMYTTRAVNVRSEPGSDYKLVKSLAKGTAVQVVEGSKTDNGWYKVDLDGKYAYVYAAFLSSTKPSASSGSNSGSSSSGGGSSSGGHSGSTSSGSSNNPGGSGSSTSGQIIYTYLDGTTGTVPKEGATYEMLPGVFVTYHEYDSMMTEEEKKDAENGIFYCGACGKQTGNGTNGTCNRNLMFGYVCARCGENVPAQTCHTCDED